MSASAKTAIVTGLLLAACLSAQQLPHSISDRVGDVVDAQERAKYDLFPTTPGFHEARFFIGPDSAVSVRVTTAGTVPLRLVLRLTPQQVHRVRFVVENRTKIREQVVVYPGARLVLERFWEDVGRTAVTDRLAGLEWDGLESGDESGPRLFDRYTCALHGMTLGSVGGGFLASKSYVQLVEPGYLRQHDCAWVPAVYHIDAAEYLGVSCGFAVAGGLTGALVGTLVDRSDAEPLDLESLSEDEGSRWLRFCVIAPGVLLGTSFALWAGSTIYGREPEGDYRSNADVVVWSSAILSGVCITAEFAYLGLLVKNAIDRRRMSARPQPGTTLAMSAGPTDSQERIRKVVR